MNNLWRSVVLAALAALLTTSVASAQEPIEVTSLTIDKVQYLMPPVGEHNYRPLIVITGTLACNADGLQTVVRHMDLTQDLGRVAADYHDNDNFWGVLCTTSSSRFRVLLESLSCEDTDAKVDCAQPGAAQVRVWGLPGMPDVVQRIVLRR